MHPEEKVSEDLLKWTIDGCNLSIFLSHCTTCLICICLLLHYATFISEEWKWPVNRLQVFVSSLELFIVSRDKQSLTIIHAVLRCTIKIVEHFLTHSWLPPSYCDSQAQGEKNVSDTRAFFVRWCVCVPLFVCTLFGILILRISKDL